MQIKTFSLNLNTSIKSFQTIKYPLKRSFQRNENIIKFFFSKVFRKTLRSNLKSSYETVFKYGALTVQQVYLTKEVKKLLKYKKSLMKHCDCKAAS